MADFNSHIVYCIIAKMILLLYRDEQAHYNVIFNDKNEIIYMHDAWYPCLQLIILVI